MEITESLTSTDRVDATVATPTRATTTLHGPVNDNLAYGFAAAHLSGQSEWNWCCSCYKLNFNSGPVAGKSMIVQVTNSGGDLGENHFDLQMPGGGFGIFDGCTRQWGLPASAWGDRYGGVHSRDDCNRLPGPLQGRVPLEI